MIRQRIKCINRWQIVITLLCVLLLYPQPVLAAVKLHPLQQTAPVIQCVQSLVLLFQGQFAVATPQLEEAVATLHESPNPNLNSLGTCALFLGIMHHSTGDWVESLAAYNIAWPAFHKNKDPQMEWAAHFGIGTVYLAQGRFAEGYTTLQETLPLTGRPANADEVACSNAEVGGNVVEQPWTTEGLKPLARAVNLNNIGIALAVPHSQKQSIGGTLADAKHCLAAAHLILQHLSEQASNPEDLVSTLLVKMTFGGTSSEDVVSNIVTEMLIGSLIPELAKAFEPILLSNLGQVAAFAGDHKQAQTYLEQALQQIKASQAQNNTDELQALLPLLTTLPELLGASLDPTWQALLRGVPELLTSMSLTSRVVNLNGEAIVLNNLALIYKDQGQMDKAQTTFQEALTIYEDKLANYPGTVTAHVNLGWLAQEAGDPAVALDHYEQAIKLLASMRSVAEGDVAQRREDKIQNFNLVGFQGILSQQADVYALAANLYLQQGRDKEAFQVIERGRARLFFDMLSSSSAHWSQQDAQLLTAVRDAFDAKIQATISFTQLRAVGSAEPKLLTQAEQELDNASTRYETALAALTKRKPQLRSLAPGVDTPIDLPTLQTQVLDKATTLIVYYIAEGILEEPTDHLAVAWVIDAKTIKAVKLKSKGKEVRRRVQGLRASIDGKDFDVAIAQQLYQDLFAPLKPYIRNRNLIIAPYGSLAYLPFAALVDAKTNKYLVEDYTITYTPSADTLALIQFNRNPNEGRMLVLGNPDGSLPSAENEAAAIAQIYETRVITRGQATESLVYTRSQQADIVHLAAHGLYSETNPLATRIELAPDAANDGALEVREVFAMNLMETNLVVLSACKTAMGPQSMGDEIPGLTRAFLYAGTPSIITTLWSIEDKASAALMTAFYQHLRTEKSFAAALRAAQLEVLNQAGWHDPYYWAAFTLHGDYLGSDK